MNKPVPVPSSPTILRLNSSCTAAGKGLLLLFFLLFAGVGGNCQYNDSYEEMTVQVHVSRMGTTELPAVISRDDVWLPVKDLFMFLKIDCSLSTGLDSVTGTFNRDPFRINYAQRVVHYQDRAIALKEQDLVQTESNLYLRLGYFGEVFGLNGQFNFRALSVSLTSSVDLPAVREMQRELMRKNLLQVKDEKQPDTIIPRRFTPFHAGTLDWSVSSLLQIETGARWRANISTGGQVAGGETEVNLALIPDQPLDHPKLYWKWRRVNDHFAALRQITVGRIFVPSVMPVLSPVTGVQLTNRPAVLHKSFGSYKLVGKTEPEWTIELYINHVLISYAKADAAGIYSFDVPLIYGSSVVTTRFYGPTGEERVQEENISIPFNFLPGKQFEYTLSAGIVQHDGKRHLYRGQANYGVSNRLTVGAGAEWLTSANQGRPVPFFSASFRMGSGILISAEYADGVQLKGNLNYRFPFRLQMDLGYLRYHRNQTSIPFFQPEGTKASFALPFRWKSYSALTRLILTEYRVLDQNKHPGSRQYDINHMISVSRHRMSANLTSQFTFSEQQAVIATTRGSVSFRTREGLRISPQLMVDFGRQQIRSVRLEADKPFSKVAFLNVSYERNFDSRSSVFNLGFRFRFPFAQTYSAFSTRGAAHSFSHTASGSILYDKKSRLLLARDRASLHRGGITLKPFLDINGNQKRDAGEPRVPGLKFKVRGGQVIANEQRSLIRIIDLEPYATYLVELDPSSFGNIAWQMKHKTLRVMVEPDQMKIVNIPVSVMGEASGMVYLQDKEPQGIGRIRVIFFDSTANPVAKTLTEADGYFSYLGLPPGQYTVKVDSAQLSTLGMSVAPAQINFSVAGSEEGVIADGFAFILRLLSVPGQDHSKDSTDRRAGAVEAFGSRAAEAGNEMVAKVREKGVARDTITKRATTLRLKNKSATPKKPVSPAKKRPVTAKEKKAQKARPAVKPGPAKTSHPGEKQKLYKRLRDGLDWYFHPVETFIREARAVGQQMEANKN